MKIIVEKYGGTSLATPEKIDAVARQAADLHNKGYGVVVVVSAMGQTTDELLTLAGRVTARPGERELGLLLSAGEIISCSIMAMALQNLGKQATALTGGQCGIYTDSVYSNAKIEKIDTSRVLAVLERGGIVIAAGYQGINDAEITVLGRGGSDATAVALAAALHAEECRIFSDVSGVYTADPRIVKDAAPLAYISYEEMIELAASGAQIMMGRAVEIGRKFNIPIHVGSSSGSIVGTIITSEEKLEKVIVTGIAVDKNVVVVDIYGVKGDTQKASLLLNKIARQKINIILLSLHKSHSDLTDISFVIRPEDVREAEEYLSELVQNGEINGYKTNAGVAQVAVVGSGIAANWGIASDVFSVLSENGIEALLLSTSEIKISAIIPQNQAETAAEKLHTIFKLSQVIRKPKEVLYV